MKRALNVVFFTLSSIVLGAFTSGCVGAPEDADPATEQAATEIVATEHVATEHVATEHVATEAAKEKAAPMDAQEALPVADHEGPPPPWAGGVEMPKGPTGYCPNGYPPLCYEDANGYPMQPCICP
jgi:hypothetical protein